MLAPMRNNDFVLLGSFLLASSTLLGCGGAGTQSGAASPTEAAAPTGPKNDPSLPKAATSPESDKCTWKKDGGKSCHTGAKGDGDLATAVTGIANACVDTKKMHMVGTPMTGEGSSTNMVKSMPVKVQANHCYRVLGLAQASVTDFDIALTDSAGKSCGEDLNDSNDAIVLDDGVVCFKQDDTINVNAAVANGQGKWAIEVWSD
jgi:hypothetical protein